MRVMHVCTEGNLDTKPRWACRTEVVHEDVARLPEADGMQLSDVQR